MAEGLAVLPLLGSVIAALAAVGQRRLKPLVAFSSLSHLPLVILALVETGCGASALCYATSLVTATAAALYASARIASKTGTDSIEELGGLYSSFPYTTWSTLGTFLVLALFPPFPSFIAEHLVSEALEADLAGLAALATSRILVLAALFYAARRAFFGPPRVRGREEAGDYALPLLFFLASLALGVYAFAWGGVVG